MESEPWWTRSQDPSNRTAARSDFADAAGTSDAMVWHCQRHVESPGGSHNNPSHRRDHNLHNWTLSETLKASRRSHSGKFRQREYKHQRLLPRLVQCFILVNRS